MRLVLFVLGLFAVIAVALPAVIQSDTLRTALARQLSTISGAEISLDGPIRLSVVPDFGIVAENISYVSEDGAVSISSARAVASVRWLSLLTNRIEISGIELENPRIALSEAKADASADSPAPTQAGDLFEIAAGYLQGLAIDRFGVSGGEVFDKSAGGTTPIATDIAIDLSVPGIDAPAAFTFSGNVDGRQVNLEGELGSLGELLARQPTAFALSAALSPAPHPGLADIEASGRIELGSDGTYRIKAGEISSAGQRMHIDAAYLPGDRPFIKASVTAETLDYSDFAPEPAASGNAGRGAGGAVDFSALRDIDLDLELRAGTIKVGNAIAQDLTVRAALQNGKLVSTVGSKQIAGGQLALDVETDFGKADPEFRGNLGLTRIDIEDLAKLAGTRAPFTGRLVSQLQYAFRGTSPAAIIDTINLRGVVGIENGAVDVPELVPVVGPGAGQIAALNARAEFATISEPFALSGSMTWNGEDVDFTAAIPLVEFLDNQRGRITVKAKSRLAAAEFSGTVDIDGDARGKIGISSGSLAGLLQWFGQDPSIPFKAISATGTLAVNSVMVGLDGARITLDDTIATGSASVDITGKPAIRADLSVNAIDVARFAGGGAAAGGSAETLDFSGLKAFDADVGLKAKRIGYGRVAGGPATAKLAVKDGIARLVVPKAAFYGGVVAVNVVANGAGRRPAVDLAVTMNGVDALPLFGDAVDFRRLEGKLDAEMAVKGGGTTTDALVRSLGGNARLVFADGAIRGIDVAKLINNLQSLIAGGYRENSDDRTEFTELSVSFAIENGIARTQDLRLLGPLVRMDGSGRVDLAAQSIDMRLNPRIVGSLEGQGSSFDVAGLGMPVIVQGPLSAPNIYPDLGNILANPDQALQLISKLGVDIGDLGTGNTDIVGVLEETLGAGGGKPANTVVKNVLQNLGQNAAGNGHTGSIPNDAQDLVSSLLQGAIGQGGRPSGVVGSIPSSAAAPSFDGPIPRPNPRRRAGRLSVLPVQEPRPAQDLTEHLVNEITPMLVPDGAGGDAAGLVNELIKGFGN